MNRLNPAAIHNIKKLFLFNATRVKSRLVKHTWNEKAIVFHVGKILCIYAGHVQTCRHRDDPSPPPPYEADFNPNMHRHHPSVETMNNRTTSLNQQAQLRQHLQQLQQQHQAETSAFRQQQQHSSNISPRQPALCIIDDGRRDNSQLNYHSTKFWETRNQTDSWHGWGKLLASWRDKTTRQLIFFFFSTT